MALKGSLSLFGITFQNTYPRLGGISGGKQSGAWTSDIQAFSDGGAAISAFDAAETSDPGSGDFASIDAVRMPSALPLVSAPYQPGVSPYQSLYTTMKEIYPSLTDA